ncbi:MAG: hypothetical protein Q8S41_12280 [Lutibacter sp.]|nr:hypothetical protein [Lutibacter sp.]
MKKVFITVISLLSAGAIAAQHGGSLIIEVTSITCQNKSYDGVVEFDGLGNEVFVSGSFHTRNPKSNNLRSHTGVTETPTFGSTAGHNERTQAGTASPSGGINNGNTFSVNKVIMSTQLDGDGYTIFSPSLWERDDNNEIIYNKFKNQLAADLASAALMPFPNFGGSNPADPFDGKIFFYGNGYNVSIPPNSYPSILSPLINIQGNRPIGITIFAGNPLMFDPKIILLEARILWAVYNQTPVNHPYPNTAYPFKTIKELSIVCGENTYAIESSNGRYTVNIAIKFAPEADDIAAANTAAQNPPVKQQMVNVARIKNIGNKTIRPIKGAPAQAPAYTMSNEMMYTEWKGLMGIYGEPNKGGPFFFKVNNNAFWLQDANGNSIASGGFRIENNNFIASYSYPNGDTYNIISTGYNPANGELTGTWSGTGANANKNGNWMAYKK